jgi:hypothetical protein
LWGKLRLHSLNPLYEPYDIDISEVREVWKFVNYISSEMPRNEPKDELLKTVQELRKDVRAIQTKLDLN